MLCFVGKRRSRGTLFLVDAVLAGPGQDDAGLIEFVYECIQVWDAESHVVSNLRKLLHIPRREKVQTNDKREALDKSHGEE